ncbi:tol-pal system protein YbgF [Methylocella sp. CPCC 101449]|jgi:tol-pal system protein YbgF|uniref:tol-pal system protein YbgF n=1 Tax=Methylocella sp. CPCC 101449 TaxID=2987531 RepID=UPI00289289D4|nr:tol-pal system protein YbgF [Methylocella sp. CPCC 101449]MDT2020961.1 tol-pal system protein YbgF [Methylocella sp. CPCC 101449]HEV2570782.1 tol-pal system protein YbgF [Beijerinckiaceae bacterium]
MTLKRFSAATALLGLAIFPMDVGAQTFRPPGQVPGQPPDGGGYYQQAQGADPAGLLLRIERLEGQLRSMTGQIEQLQYQNRQLQEQMQRMGGAPAGGGESRPPPQRRSEAGTAPAPVAPPSRGGRNDAYDPDADPNAPGAPRVIGSLPETRGGRLPQGPIDPMGPPIIDEGDDDGGGPIDLTNPNGRIPRSGGSMRQGSISSSPLPAPAPGSQPVQPQPQQQVQSPPSGAGDQVASLPPVAGPRGEFDQAVATFKKGQYESAEGEFRNFVSRYPTGRLTPEATYYLGETFSRRNRHREAAEQFLKVSTDYPKSGSVPQSLYRLGQSLDKLGAKEQACAAWGEIGRKYPTASASLRNAADREYKRAQC